MAHYEIRIQSPDGRSSMIWDVEGVDDLAALKSALDICIQQKIEVWDSHRQIGSVSISGQPHLTL